MTRDLWIEFPPYKDVTDFPSLISGVNMPAIFWDNVEADGDDIALYDNAGNKLKRELVSIDTVNKTMELYVKKTRSATSPTYIRLNYDDAAGAETNDTDVWESAAVTIDEGTGECVAMPITRSATAPLTLAIATAGTFTVTVPAGASVTFISDTATVTDSPKTLTANGSITVEDTGNITMQVHGFVMVQHMNDDPDNTAIADSTVNANDGAKGGAGAPVEAAGAFSGDKAQDYDGNDEINVTAAASLRITDTITLSALVRLTTLTDTDTFIFKYAGTATRSNYLLLGRSTGKFRFQYRNAANNASHTRMSTNVVYGANEWVHLAATHTYGTGADTKLYVNGVEVASSWATGDGNDAPMDVDNVLCLGADGVNNQYYITGKMSEVRISQEIQSADWIAATHRNLMSNAADYEVMPVYYWGREK